MPSCWGRQPVGLLQEQEYELGQGNEAAAGEGWRDRKSPVLPAAKLMQILGTSPGYRNLTPYEIELLRKSKEEMDQITGEVLAEAKGYVEEPRHPRGVVLRDFFAEL